MENVVYRILEGDCITEMAKMFRKDLKNTIIKRDNSVMEIKKIKFNLAKDVLCALINSECTLNDDGGKEIPFNKENLVNISLEISDILFSQLPTTRLKS